MSVDTAAVIAFGGIAAFGLAVLAACVLVAKVRDRRGGAR